jgi:hypothetical protein
VINDYRAFSHQQNRKQFPTMVVNGVVRQCTNFLFTILERVNTL